MPTLDHLTLLRDELAAFAAHLDGDLRVPVPHCGSWTLYELADHVGTGNLWAAAAVRERHGRLRPPPAPREPRALRAWFHDTAETLLSTLDGDPDAEAWTFAPPHTVGFWRRRRCLETLVHRYDAATALGRPAVLDPRLAADGVAEVLDTMHPRQVRLGRAPAPPHALRLESTDTGDAWTLGPGAPLATVRGGAAALLLLLWGRCGPGDPALGWQGDRAAGERVLDGPLVP